MNFNKEKDRLLHFVKCAVITVITILIIFFGCPLRRIFGISCAGCGMVRATAALLTGDIQAAFHCHPCVFLLPGIIYLIFYCKRRPRKIKIAAFITVAFIFNIVYAARLISGNDIVTPDFANSALKDIFDIFTSWR